MQPNNSKTSSPLPLAWSSMQTLPNMVAGFTTFQNTLYCFYPSANGQNIDYSISTDGVQWKTVTSSGLSFTYSTSFNSAFAELNGNLYGIFQPFGNLSEINIFNTNDGINWQSPNSNASIISDALQAPPSLVEFNFNLYCAYLSQSKPNQVYYTSSSDGINWQPSLKLPAVVAAGGPVLIEFMGRLFCFYPHADNTGQVDGELWYTSSADGITWLLPQQLTEISGLVISPSLSIYNGFLYCLCQLPTQNNSAFFYVASADGISWNTVQQVPDTSFVSKQFFLAQFSNYMYWVFTVLDSNTSYIIYTNSSVWPPVLKDKKSDEY